MPSGMVNEDKIGLKEMVKNEKHQQPNNLYHNIKNTKSARNVKIL